MVEPIIFSANTAIKIRGIRKSFLARLEVAVSAVFRVSSKTTRFA